MWTYESKIKFVVGNIFGIGKARLHSVPIDGWGSSPYTTYTRIQSVDGIKMYIKNEDIDFVIGDEVETTFIIHNNKIFLNFTKEMVSRC